MDDKNVGKIIGIYKVCSVCDERANDGHLKYHVRCIYCGFETDMILSHIKEPKTCRHVRPNGEYMSWNYKWSVKRLNRIFHGMISRCYNPHNKDYIWYGEKGITICDEWLNNPILFEKWAMENGYEDNLSIDRIDSSKNYCPENCQWIPLSENTQKAGKVNWITIDDITLTGKQWAKKLDLGVNTINTYIRKYGVDKTKELITKMLENPQRVKNINQSWFSVYGIQV